MDDKQGPHAVVRRPADPRPLAGQNLHLRLADSHRLEGLLLKTHNALSPADLMQSVGRTLCSQPDLPYAVGPADHSVSVGLILLDNFRINPRTVHINYFLF